MNIVCEFHVKPRNNVEMWQHLHAFLPQKKAKKAIRDILNKVNQDVDDFIWETEWNVIYSARTLVMGGYKLESTWKST